MSLPASAAHWKIFELSHQRSSCLTSGRLFDKIRTWLWGRDSVSRQEHKKYGRGGWKLLISHG